MPNSRTARILLFALACGLAAGAAAPATAQLPTQQVGNFGTQVRAGDMDYLPMTKKDSAPVTVTEVTVSDRGAAVDDCIVLDTGAANGVSNNDLRLTPCLGKPVGTVSDGSDALGGAVASVPIAAAGLHFLYGDIDGSASYNKGDFVFLSTAAGTLAQPGAPGTWTIRLTPNNGLPAGTMVKPLDSDFHSWHAQVKPLVMSLVQRDDKSFYFVPAPAAPVAGFLPKNSPIPPNSIRLSANPPLQPQLLALSLAQGSAGDIEAGKDFAVAATVTNGGTAAGAGIIVTKVNGLLADARMSPVLGPGETATFLIPLTAPAAAGPLTIKVNDATMVAVAKGGAAAPPAPSAEVQALQGAVADLESRLHNLEAPPKPAAASVQPLAPVGVGAAAPALQACAMMALVAALVVGLRARKQ